MPAETYGAINFGLTDETGFYIDSASFDWSAQEVWTSDAGGDDVAGAVFKQEGTFTLEGVLKTDDSPTWTLGINLTIASLSDEMIASMIPGYTSGALTIVTAASFSLENEQLEGRTISGVIKPFMSALNVIVP